MENRRPKKYKLTNSEKEALSVEPPVSVRLEIAPGTLVYIDNRITLHSREAFSASFDAAGRAKRWVQRVFIAPSLWTHRKLVRSKHRVFQPQKAV
jgi:alpha-ketoglutarate-dependent taurine dioxygenase